MGRTHEAFVKEAELLGLEVPHTFTLPTSWGRRYPVLARALPLWTQLRGRENS